MWNANIALTQFASSWGRCNASAESGLADIVDGPSVNPQAHFLVCILPALSWYSFDRESQRLMSEHLSHLLISSCFLAPDIICTACFLAHDHLYTGAWRKSNCIDTSLRYTAWRPPSKLTSVPAVRTELTITLLAMTMLACQALHSTACCMCVHIPCYIIHK